MNNNKIAQAILLSIEIPGMILYGIQWSQKISRAVLFLLIVFGVFFDLMARRWLGRYLGNKYGENIKTCRILLIGKTGEIDQYSVRLKKYGIKRDHETFGVRSVVSVVCDESGRIEDIENTDNYQDKYDLIYITGEAYKHIEDKQYDIIDNTGVPICIDVNSDNGITGVNTVISAGGSAGIYKSQMSEICNVLGVDYVVTNIEEAVKYVTDHAENLEGDYICFSNVHTLMEAHDDAAYRDVLNKSVFTFPDGKPVAKEIKNKGNDGAERVAGPDFMTEAFKITMNGRIKHFFYGSTQETLDKLKENLNKEYPGINIAGMYSPPFRNLTEDEDEEIINMINKSGADLVWIGLGAPKQEKWMYEHRDKINGLMLGVGAGFDFHAGTLNRAPEEFQKMGLEWLYRLMQDPVRLFKRYFITNIKFLWNIKILRR